MRWEVNSQGTRWLWDSRERNTGTRLNAAPGVTSAVGLIAQDVK